MFFAITIVLMFFNLLFSENTQNIFSLAAFLFAGLAFVYTNANYFFGIRDCYLRESMGRLKNFYRPIYCLEEDLKRKNYDITNRDEIIKELENIEQYQYFGAKDTKESFQQFKEIFSSCISLNKTSLDQNEKDILNNLLRCVERDIKFYEKKIDENLDSLE